MESRFEIFLKEARLALSLGCLIFLNLTAVAQTDNAAYVWSTVAGTSGTGSVDGIGGNARFATPIGIVTDTNGNIYVADSGNNTIRKITPAGVVSTIAGLAGNFPGNYRSADGTNSAARFNNPQGLAIDSAGNLYVADTFNFAIRKMTPAGTNWVVTTIAGTFQVFGTNDGTGSAARFYVPEGLAVDGATNIYVVDSGNYSIRKMTLVGTHWVVTTIAGLPGFSETIDGTNNTAHFRYPFGVAVDNAHNVYVTDTEGNCVRKMTLVGTNWVVTTIAGVAGQYGTADGTNGAAQFVGPYGICLDNANNVYVADGGDEAIRKMTPIGTNWVVTTIAGNTSIANQFGIPIGGSADGTGANARFNMPYGVTADIAGNVYVADTFNNTIRKVTSVGVVTTVAGQSISGSSVDGTGNEARFDSPDNIAVDNAGNIFVADSDNSTIRKITSAGIVTTMAGLAGTSGTNDGAGNFARFNQPQGVAVDANGNVFVADTTNNTIRRITSAGLVSTIAGSPTTSGTKDGTNGIAQFNSPESVAVDGAGNVYVADFGNSAIRKITLVGTNWVVTTISGLSGTSGSADGTNGIARFNHPYGIAIDGATNLYVVDQNNSTIRKITPVGTNWVVSTIAGQIGNAFVWDGVGTNAFFGLPYGIAADTQGNLYVADNSRIRKITQAGTNWVISTIGNVVLDSTTGSADGAGSAAQFEAPQGIAVDSAGNVYVADTGNNTIRKGVFTAYGVADEAAYSQPVMNSSLKVVLQPAEAGGQWRFPWEVAWRNSGQVAGNLVAGNYPVEFRNVPGWLAVPLSLTVGVTNAVALTNQYYPTISTVDTNSGGTLTVTLGPSPPVGAGWRFLGDSTPFYPSGYSTNLIAGTYLVQFAPVGGRVIPPNLSVQVQAGQTTYLSENYLLASSAPSQVLLPFPVPANNINDLADYPFGFNGQLQSDNGYGSGVAVQTNVVLTAAHMVFDDQTLSYVSQAWWYFQREAGTFDPEPLAARGWYVLSGYAAQRTNDLAEFAPDTSTPQSRNEDVAALYFLSPVAGGGYGGYLPSDATPNPWLTGNSLKMLAGYPVDGSEFGDASVATNAGRMYQTTPQPYPLTLAGDTVTNRQEVYIAPWFLSYPGNSGGPVYAQFNGYYYPAGVYLGTLYSGVTPYASAVRAIDSDVVNLITNAAALGDTGTNHTGGGVITIIPNQALSAFNPGYLQFQLSPASAVTAGAGWRLQGDSSYLSAPNSIRAVTTSNAAVQFKAIAGWSLPTNAAVNVTAGNLNSYNAFYTVSNPVLSLNANGIGIIGTTGTVYVIQRRNSLASGSWTNVSTNTITSAGLNFLLPNPATNGPANFYRALWLP